MKRRKTKAKPASKRSSTTGVEKPKAKILRGMQDLLPEKRKRWDYFFGKANNLARSYGFERINVPLLEEKWLFKKGTGEATEALETQIYEFFDKRGRVRVALRPEFFPSITRAYIDHEMFNLAQPVKLYYSGPVFRYEKLEPHRFNQFHLFGLQIIGSDRPVSDVELILFVDSLFKELNLKINLEINSLGCSRCRSFYRKKLYNFLKKKKKYLCPLCQKNLEKSPAYVFECEERECLEIVRQAPQILDSLCEKCEEYFNKVLEYLDATGVIYHLNPYLIRNFDFYNGPVFEIYSPGTSLKSAFGKIEEKGEALKLGSGGRFDRLTGNLGGPTTPACGLSLGVERIIREIEEEKIKIPERRKAQIFLARISDLATIEALKVKKLLVEHGFGVNDNLKEENLSSQLESANKLKLKFILIIGHQEVLDKTIILRDLSTHAQETINREKIIEEIKKRLKK